MTIEQTVAAVQNAPGSMYTREDVISLLNKLEIPKATSGVLTQTQIEELCHKIFDHVKENAENLDSDDVCDKESAEYELYGNEINLTSVDIDTRHIANNVVDGVGDVIETFFEDLKEDNN